MKKHFTVVLAGNPNCGKTCIFNALTGARQHVGNYPGVTVESKAGNFSLNGKMIQLIDLPGIYSLSSSSPEEEVAFRELTRPGIDLIVNVIDSTIPQRSLYLTMQLAELGIPMLLAFNMSDDAEARGLVFDIPKFERNFGSPVARTVGNKNGGVQPLLDKLAELLEHPESGCSTPLSYGEDVDDAIRAVSEKIDALAIEKYRHLPSRFLAVKLLEHDSCALRIEELRPARETADEQLLHLRNRHAIETDTFMADRRYAMVAGACRGAITMSRERRREIPDRIDVVMTSKYIGLPLFFLIIYLTFWFTFTLADPLMGYIETGFAWLSDAVKNLWPETMMPYLRSLLTDGVIGGVGGVLVFLPNILFLFFAIAILEDSGYMARAAFVMDGVMRRFGLQGRSFVPLVLGFGCTVPAIMATRCIESERDRKTTIMVLPLMSCSARLPIYVDHLPDRRGGRPGRRPDSEVDSLPGRRGNLPDGTSAIPDADLPESAAAHVGPRPDVRAEGRNHHSLHQHPPLHLQHLAGKRTVFQGLRIRDRTASEQPRNRPGTAGFSDCGAGKRTTGGADGVHHLRTDRPRARTVFPPHRFRLEAHHRRDRRPGGERGLRLPARDPLRTGRDG